MIAVRVLTITFVVVTAAVGRADDVEARFELEIRPLLMRACADCHGPDLQESGLRLDARHGAFKGGDGGPVIVAGRADESELLRRVTSTDPDVRMPPEGPALTDDEVRLLRAWIDAGADWPETDYDRAAAIDPRLKHWAFQPLQAVSVPELQEGLADAAGFTDIDRFLLAELQQHGLTFNPQADRRTLIRRAFLDLTGLPPTSDAVTQFDPSDRSYRTDQAFKNLVDSLLASPRYGERWASHWLDIVRYADTHGFEVNTPRDNAWPYRDYVIQAFNNDTPFDQFVREQLAGDVLGADEATGFLVASAVLLPGQIGADDVSKRQARQDALDEIIVGTSSTFLGLTIGCARCHDHKFDPITARDYYSMQAFFAGVDYGDRAIRKSALPERVPAATSPAEPGTAPVEPMIYGGVFREPDATFVLRRGDSEQRVEEIGAAIPALFNGDVAPSDGSLCDNESALSIEQQRRLALADWLSSPDNPLTARVMVNRIWQHHFGRGLVDTPNDFGLNGGKPSHPTLLDWLAAEFIRSGWSVKHMHRLIMTSVAYQQSNQIRQEAMLVDGDNRLLWQFTSRRLESEAIRDGLLFVCGQLNLQTGGPGFGFFKARGGLDGFPPVEEFTPAELRRMVYSHKVRMESVPVFGAFDCPDAGQSMPRRSRSTTAIQALNLFNSPFVLQQSTFLADQIVRESADLDSQIDAAFQRVLTRLPDDAERSACRSVAESHGLAQVIRALLNSSEFLTMP